MKNKVLHFLFLLLCTAGVTNLFAQSFNEGILNYTVNADGTLEAVKAELSAKTGIDQADISKIERGIANPSVATLKRLANGLGAELNVSFDLKDVG